MREICSPCDPNSRLKSMSGVCAQAKLVTQNTVRIQLKPVFIKSDPLPDLAGAVQSDSGHRLLAGSAQKRRVHQLSPCIQLGYESVGIALEPVLALASMKN